MKLSQVRDVLGAKVLCGEEFLDEVVVESAFGADMMSDVLAYVRQHALIITGMLNTHVIRTAEMIDIRAVVFVRGKIVTPEIIEAANELDMIILGTDKTMFTACGLLYEAGLRSCTR